MTLTLARATQLQQLLRQGTQVVTLVALARLGLALEELGNFESLVYVGTLLTGFWLNAAAASFLRARQATAQPGAWYAYFLGVALLLGLAASVLLAGATPLLGGALLDNPALRYALPYATYLIGLLAGAAVEQEAIGDRTPWRLLAYTGSSSAVQLGLFLGPLALGYPFYFAVWGLAASALYRLAWVQVRLLRVGSGRLPPVEERSRFWRGTRNLSVYGLGAVVVLAVDHALVGHSTDGDAGAMALWRYGARELPLLVGVVGALTMTALAEGQELTGGSLATLRRRSRLAMRAFMPLAIVLAASSGWWWPALFGEPLAPAGRLFAAMLLIVPTRLIVTTPQLLALDAEGVITRVGAAEVLVNVAVSLALLPALGLLGVALGTVVAYAFERAAYVVYLRRRGVPLRAYCSVAELAAWTVLLLAAVVYSMTG